MGEALGYDELSLPWLCYVTKWARVITGAFKGRVFSVGGRWRSQRAWKHKKDLTRCRWFEDERDHMRKNVCGLRGQ